MRIAIKFAYDGRNFNGYARQPNLKTVEGTIIKNLMKLGYIKNIKESFFRSASRTDKGVSAICNVIAFNTDYLIKNRLKFLSNEFEDIIIYGFKVVGHDFNPRHARLRHYRYYLKNDDFDLEKIMLTASLFTGEHDFSNFARIESFRNQVQTIDNIIIIEKENFIILDFYAQHFLWHQIRRIVSAINKNGEGKLEKKQIINALSNTSKKIDFGIASPNPLILKDIIYNFEFDYDINKLSKIKDLENRIIKSLYVSHIKSPKC